MPGSSTVSQVHIPQVPWPPNDQAMNYNFQLIFNVVLWIAVVAFVVFAYRLYRKDGSIVPFLLLIGGGLSMFIEPVIDYLGLCWFYSEGQWELFRVFDRPIPTWMLPTYIFYVGGQALYTLTRLEKGETMAGIWKLYAVYFVVNIVLEEPPLWMGLYTYYGAQPFQPLLLPMWWPLINAAMPIVAAALVYHLRPHLQGWKILAVIPLVPMSDVMANAVIGFPIWISLNSSDSLLINNLAGCLSVLLTIIVIYTIALAVGSDSPARSSEKPAPASQPQGNIAAV